MSSGNKTKNEEFLNSPRISEDVQTADFADKPKSKAGADVGKKSEEGLVFEPDFGQDEIDELIESSQMGQEGQLEKDGSEDLRVTAGKPGGGRKKRPQKKSAATRSAKPKKGGKKISNADSFLEEARRAQEEGDEETAAKFYKKSVQRYVQKNKLNRAGDIAIESGDQSLLQEVEDIRLKKSEETAPKTKKGQKKDEDNQQPISRSELKTKVETKTEKSSKQEGARGLTSEVDIFSEDSKSDLSQSGEGSSSEEKPEEEEGRSAFLEMHRARKNHGETSSEYKKANAKWQEAKNQAANSTERSPEEAKSKTKGDKGELISKLEKLAGNLEAKAQEQQGENVEADSGQKSDATVQTTEQSSGLDSRVFSEESGKNTKNRDSLSEQTEDVSSRAGDVESTSREMAVNPEPETEPESRTELEPEVEPELRAETESNPEQKENDEALDETLEVLEGKETALERSRNNFAVALLNNEDLLDLYGDLETEIPGEEESRTREYVFTKKEYLSQLKKERVEKFAQAKEAIKELSKKQGGMDKAKKERVLNEKVREIIQETVVREARALHDAKESIRERVLAEKVGNAAYKKILKMAESAVSRYRKLPLKAKIGISATLFGLGVAGTAVTGPLSVALTTGSFSLSMSQRVFSGGAAALGFNELIKKKQDKRAAEKTIKKMTQDDSNREESGTVENREAVESDPQKLKLEKANKLLESLQADNRNLDEELLGLEKSELKKKYWRMGWAGAAGLLLSLGASRVFAGLADNGTEALPESGSEVGQEATVETAGTSATEENLGEKPGTGEMSSSESGRENLVENSGTQEESLAESGLAGQENATERTPESETADMVEADHTMENAIGEDKLDRSLERGPTSNFTLELGQGEVPSQLERVFHMMAVDHMERVQDAAGMFTEEPGAKSLNVAANLVRLAEGNDTLGISADQFKEAVSWDAQSNILQIQDYQAFNETVEKLQSHADELWEEGKLQKGAVAYLDDIKQGTWEKIIHAEGLDKAGEIETGVEGHDYIKGEDIKDFQSSDMVQEANKAVEGAAVEDVSEGEGSSPDQSKESAEQSTESTENTDDPQAIQRQMEALNERIAPVDAFAFNTEEYRVIKDLSIGELLDAIPEKNEWQYFDNGSLSDFVKTDEWPHSGERLRPQEFSKQVNLAAYIREQAGDVGQLKNKSVGDLMSLPIFKK